MLRQNLSKEKTNKQNCVLFVYKFVYQFVNFFQAEDLDDLIKAHSSYVEKLYDRCLLSQKVKWTYCIEGFELLNSHKWQRENFSQ